MLNIFHKFYKNSLVDSKCNKKQYYWLQLHMLIPNSFTINPAVFKMKCGNIRTKRNTIPIYIAFTLCIQITHKANNPNSHFNENVTKTLQPSFG